eukprot:GAHX01000427.1.p1 GENE.GAHX01000427.1~~GAHX01000427.1.p1  ORF type:complete len:981 (-),score=220.11 GAHX01000427.1:45-2987(-)
MNTPKEIGSKYQVLNEIGRGASAVVYKASQKKTKHLYALKHFTAEDVDLSIQKEVSLMENLSHPNIIKYIETVVEGRNFYVVLEYASNGPLRKLVRSGCGIPENIASCFIKQVLLGLKYLHDEGVIHRDIKAANILLDEENIVKLADFGVATSGERANQTISVVGTPYWMAPEIVEMSSQPTDKCDIWSLACTVLELITTKPPFYELGPMAAMYKIVTTDRPPFPKGISADLKDFLTLCFQKDPTQRADAKALLKHNWIKKGSDEPVNLEELQRGQMNDILETSDSVEIDPNKSSSETDTIKLKPKPSKVRSPTKDKNRSSSIAQLTDQFNFKLDDDRVINNLSGINSVKTIRTKKCVKKNNVGHKSRNLENMDPVEFIDLIGLRKGEQNNIDAMNNLNFVLESNNGIALQTELFKKRQVTKILELILKENSQSCVESALSLLFTMFKNDRQLVYRVYCNNLISALERVIHVFIHSKAQMIAANIIIFCCHTGKHKNKHNKHSAGSFNKSKSNNKDNKHINWNFVFTGGGQMLNELLLVLESLTLKGSGSFIENDNNNDYKDDNLVLLENTMCTLHDILSEVNNPPIELIEDLLNNNLIRNILLNLKSLIINEIKQQSYNDITNSTNDTNKNIVIQNKNLDSCLKLLIGTFDLLLDYNTDIFYKESLIEAYCRILTLLHFYRSNKETNKLFHVLEKIVTQKTGITINSENIILEVLSFYCGDLNDEISTSVSKSIITLIRTNLEHIRKSFRLGLHEKLALILREDKISQTNKNLVFLILSLLVSNGYDKYNDKLKIIEADEILVDKLGDFEISEDNRLLKLASLKALACWSQVNSAQISLAFSLNDRFTHILNIIEHCEDKDFANVFNSVNILISSCKLLRMTLADSPVMLELIAKKTKKYSNDVYKIKDLLTCIHRMSLSATKYYIYKRHVMEMIDEILCIDKVIVKNMVKEIKLEMHNLKKRESIYNKKKKYHCLYNG